MKAIEEMRQTLRDIVETTKLPQLARTKRKLYESSLIVVGHCRVARGPGDGGYGVVDIVLGSWAVSSELRYSACWASGWRIRRCLRRAVILVWVTRVLKRA
jgi:hypothetical protein